MPKKSKTLLSDSSIISDDKEQSKTSDIDETLPLTSFPDDKEHLEQYCHYIESEEVPKQDKISLQIELNEKAPLEDIVTADGTLIHKKTLLAVDSYSTRFLKIDDQFLLAVDKIAFPEVKGGFRPSPQFKASRTEYIDWPGIVFSSTFSLNDGDENAYRKLVAAFSHAQKEKYIYTILPASVYPGSFDETSTFRSLSREEKSKTVHKLENDLYKLLDVIELDISVTRRQTNHVEFSFDIYDKGEKPVRNLSKSSDIPCVSAVLSIQKNIGDNQYTSYLNWNYIIFVLTAVKDKGQFVLPDDMTVKLYYEAGKVLIRSAIADMGIYPARLSEF